MNTSTILKDLMKKKMIKNDKKPFYSSIKDQATDDNGGKLDGYISNKDYLTCKKIQNEFNMKNMDNYYKHYLKKMF